MIVSIIAAISPARVIGRDGALPWRVHTDMRRFVRLTTGKPVVMGRGTFESMGGALSKRQNVVLSRAEGWSAAGVEVVGSLEAALTLLADAPEVMVIGGAQIYEGALPFADRLYLSVIEGDYAGDTWFPHLDLMAWGVLSEVRCEAGPKDEAAHTFFELRRRSCADAQEGPLHASPLLSSIFGAKGPQRAREGH